MNDNNLNNIAYELFGSMRYLTPEENKNKSDMYRNMSTAINETELFDKEIDNDR
jgi:hypothetical protein